MQKILKTPLLKTPLLKTKRLILRPLQLKDAPALQKHFNNWNVIKHLNDKIPWPYPDNGAEDFIKNDALPRIAKGYAHLWVIIPHNSSDSTPIGLIEFRAIKTEDCQEDRGFWIAEPFWGKGYMSEAVEAVNDFIFFNLKRKRITLQNYKSNIGSRRVKEKTGATFIKTIPAKWRGEECEIELWELTLKQWRDFRSSH